jgi:hypothetical protein
MYERQIDLMDKCMSPQNAYMHYAQKENPQVEISSDLSIVPQSNSEIADFVINQMSDTLGAVDGS